MDALHVTWVQVTEPVTALVTKFGGQPVWLASADWPLSRRTGEPMVFVGQIRIPDFINSHGDLRMAYIFMTLNSDVDNTSDPDGGENRVIIQVGDLAAQPVMGARGPCVGFNDTGAPINPQWPCEFLVEGERVDDGVYVPESERADWTQEVYEQLYALLDYDKIGGHPLWYQSEDFPYPEAKLLLQLSDNSPPFWVNFGCGVAYVCTDAAVQEAKMLWQC